MAGDTISLSGLLDAVTTSDYGINNAKAGIQSQIDDINEQARVKAAAVTQAGEDAAIVQRKLGGGQLQAQNDAREIAAHLGTNREAGNYRMLDLADQMTASYDAANAQLGVINRDKSVSITDGPIKYIAAQLKLKGDTAQYNAAVDKHNIASEFMDNIVAKTTAATAQQYAIADTRDAASIAADADQHVQKAIADVAGIKQQTAAYNISGIKDIQALTGQQLDDKFKIFHAVAAEDQRRVMNEDRAERRRMAEAQWDEIQKNKQADEATVATVSLGSQSAGFGPITASQYMSAIKMGGSVAQRMRDFYTSGAIRNASGEIIVGGNAGQAARFIAETGAPLTPADDRNRDFVMHIFNEVVNGTAPELTGKTINTKDAHAVDTAIQDIVTKRALEQQKNIKAGDATNIYQAPPVQTVAKGNAGFAATPLYQKVLKTMATSAPDGFASDPGRFIDLALDAAAEGKITWDEAIDGTATFYRAATELNNKTSAYAKLHIPEPNMSGAYNTRLSPLAMYSNKYNIANKTDLIRYATLRQMSRASEASASYLIRDIMTGGEPNEQ